MIIVSIFLMLIIMLYAYGLKWDPIYTDFYSSGEMIIIGHRGAPILAVENTIESFNKAFEAGIQGIELDVQLSKDGVLVVFHDWSLKNLTGYSENIEDMDYLEIREIAHANNYQIPILSKVLEICPKGKLINIEIKSRHYLNTQLVTKVVNMIYKYKIEKFVVISSFNPFVLRFAKKLAPNFKTAYLWSSKYTSFLFNSPLWILMCQPDGFHIDINNADEKNISWVRKNNLNVLAFTVNNAADVSKARELGLDGIFTDDPYLITNSASS